MVYISNNQNVEFTKESTVTGEPLEYTAKKTVNKLNATAGYLPVPLELAGQQAIVIYANDPAKLPSLLTQLAKKLKEQSDSHNTKQKGLGPSADSPRAPEGEGNRSSDTAPSGDDNASAPSQSDAINTGSYRGEKSEAKQ